MDKQFSPQIARNNLKKIQRKMRYWGWNTGKSSWAGLDFDTPSGRWLSPYGPKSVLFSGMQSKRIPLCIVSVSYLLVLEELFLNIRPQWFCLARFCWDSRSWGRTQPPLMEAFHFSTLYRFFRTVHMYDLTDSTKERRTTYFILKMRKLSLGIRNLSGTFW